VNLVHKENSPPSVEPPSFIGPVNGLPDILNPGKHRVKAFKNAFGGVGDYPCLEGRKK
jgi:hypothetical protein